MRRSVVFLAALGVAAFMGHVRSGPVLAAVCDGSTTALGNGGFENPPVPANVFVSLPAADVPPWQTTDALGEIELWGTGFGGVPAGEGSVFAELNANTAGTLYQDVVTTPGATMSWTLLHRARGGTDVMQVLIGDAKVADVNGAAGWGFISADLSDDTTAWGTHTGNYVVPAGQTCSRFAFRAVSTGSGSDSVGNFLDGVAFTVSIPAQPTPTTPPTDLAVAAASSGDGYGPLGATFALLLAGLAGAIAAARVRRRHDRFR